MIGHHISTVRVAYGLTVCKHKRHACTRAVDHQPTVSVRWTIVYRQLNIVGKGFTRPLCHYLQRDIDELARVQ